MPGTQGLLGSLGTVLPVVVAAGAGVWAGAGARVLLRRMRRGTRIPPPWCELGVAVLWAATAVAGTVGGLPVRWVPVVLALGWLVVAAGAVDLRHRRLPNTLTVPALPAALLLLLPVGPQAAVRGAAGAAVAVAVHAAVHLADRRAVGAGDVKLAAPLGAVLAAVAWPALALAALLAALLTAAGAAMSAPAGVGAGARSGVAAGAGGVLARAGQARTVPHGPSMLVSCWLVAVVLLALGAGGGTAAG
ncbi:prepilin peptidase [Pseudonocardia zijingensis]|jgi:leader peptidase (prepilin peptidase)/N-methyltransferase|uniref:prepilin peptidase n=1 Tax=Pseudonocardia zijingensis TaxID=153376 RepID=UPI00360AF752